MCVCVCVLHLRYYDVWQCQGGETIRGQGLKPGFTEEAPGNYNQIHFIVSYYSHWLVGVKIYSQSFEGFSDYNKQQIMNEPTTDQFPFPLYAWRN